MNCDKYENFAKHENIVNKCLRPLKNLNFILESDTSAVRPLGLKRGGGRTKNKKERKGEGRATLAAVMNAWKPTRRVALYEIQGINERLTTPRDFAFNGLSELH